MKKILIVVTSMVLLTGCVTTSSTPTAEKDESLSKAQMDAAISAATPACKRLFDKYSKEINSVSIFEDSDRWSAINNDAQKVSEKEGCNERVLVTIGADSIE